MGESIQSGILANWHVQSGDTVTVGQVLYELETDKVTSEALAEADGVIILKVQEGQEVAIGSVVATIAAGEAPKEEASEAAAAKESKEPPAEALKAKEASPPPAPAPRALPAVAPPRVMLPAHPDDGPVTKKPLSRLRQRLAQRLVQAQHEAAMLTTFNECDMQAVMDLRAKHQEAFVERHGIKLGFMSFFVKAAVRALRQYPEINARLEGDTLVQHDYYSIGVAVSTDKGLMVPVLRNCDQRSFADIEKDIAHYAQAARSGTLALSDLQGGVFTLTNGGVFGSLLSTPILNPPQCAILGMHTIQKRPVALNDQVVIRPMMYLALTYDHRIVDGRQAVSFLVSIKQAIEDPARLLIEG